MESKSFCYDCGYWKMRTGGNYVPSSKEGSITYLPYKEYKCGCGSTIRIWMDNEDGSNINKQNSEQTQLKEQGCCNWKEIIKEIKQKKPEVYEQMNMFDVLGI